MLKCEQCDSGGPGSLLTTWISRILKADDLVERAFCPEYRLAAVDSHGESINPFPAAIVDCLAGYMYLLQLGFQPHNITFAGDSAGGHIALALVRHLILANIPVPGSMILLSPAGDWTGSHRGAKSSLVTNRTSDFAGEFFYTLNCADAIRGTLTVDELAQSMWTAPAGQDVPSSLVKGWFTGFPRTLLLAGGAETALDSMVTLRDRMRADMGSDLVWHVEPDAPHEWPNMRELWDPEGRDAIKRCLRFIGEFV
jgi:acetyl esterase/lipase